MGKRQKRKGDPSKVNPYIAGIALQRACGDRKKAYSECVRLEFQRTGKLDCGFSNFDLQAFYDELYGGTD